MIEPAIRPAVRDDLPGVLALYRYLHPDDPELDLAAAETAWSALLFSDLTTIIVADVAGLLVSSCTLAIIPNLNSGSPTLWRDRERGDAPGQPPRRARPWRPSSCSQQGVGSQ